MNDFADRVYDRRDWNALALGLLGVAVVGIAFGTVRMPWVIVGAVAGVLVLATAMAAPLALVAAMLMIGPVDLSFMTGGFKSLLPSLGGLDMNGIRLIGATAGFIAYIMFEPRAMRAALGAHGRLWLVFLGYAGATLALSISPLEGLRFLLKLAYPFLTFLIVIGVCDSRERIDKLMRYTLIGAAIMTILVNPLLVMSGGYRIENGFTRVGGLGVGDNPFALYLTIMLLIAFTRFMLRLEWLSLALSVVFMVWLALTMTRIAALAAVAGLAIIAMLGAFAAGNKKVLVGSALAAFAIAVVLTPQVLMRSLGFVPSPLELVQLARNPLVLYEAINWQGRELLWAILWVAFMGSPLVGLGLGSSSAVIRENFPDQSVDVAHNEYLRLSTDTGLLGVALFAAACIVWLTTAFRLSIRGDRMVREFAFPAVAGIVCWAIVSVTDNPFDYYTPFTQYIGFLVAGALVANGEASS